MPTPFSRCWALCPVCSQKRREDHERETLAEQKAARKAEWREICPPDFLGTNPSALPNQGAYNETMAWQYGRSGLLLIGPTGTGKSRSAWALAEREFKAAHSVLALNALAGMDYARRYSDSIYSATEWVSRAVTTSLLILDDVFKVKLTDSFEAALFAIISERTENHRPCIVTSNDTGESLLRRFSPDRGEPFVRRLREFCQTIVFELAPANPAS